MTVPATQQAADFHIPADAIADALRECGITHVFTVADYVTLAVHQLLLEGYLPGVRVVECCTEDEAVTAASAAWIGGAKPVVIMQNQGLHACMNNLRGCGLEAMFPIFMIVGQMLRESTNVGRDPQQSRRPAVQVTERLLEAYNIPYFRLETTDDLPAIEHACRIAFIQSRPTAVLVGAPSRWTRKDVNDQ